jgi:hypothetical protein
VLTKHSNDVFEQGISCAFELSYIIWLTPFGIPAAIPAKIRIGIRSPVCPFSVTQKKGTARKRNHHRPNPVTCASFLRPASPEQGQQRRFLSRCCTVGIISAAKIEKFLKAPPPVAFPAPPKFITLMFPSGKEKRHRFERRFTSLGGKACCFSPPDRKMKSSFGHYTSSAVPPAASIASFADPENLLAFTVSLRSSVPFPRTLIPSRSFFTTPDSTS